MYSPPIEDVVATVVWSV